MKFPGKVETQGFRRRLLNSTHRHRGLCHPVRQMWSSAWALRFLLLSMRVMLLIEEEAESLRT